MSRMTRRGHRGSGPGEFTPDGCAVETFLSRPLSTSRFEEALAAAGPAVAGYLTEDRTRVRALPVAPGV